MKKKLLDILVVGSGLSSLSFINSYLEKNKKIHLIYYDKVIKKKFQILINIYLSFCHHKWHLVKKK